MDNGLYTGHHNGHKEGLYLNHNPGLLSNDFSMSGYSLEAKTLFRSMNVQPEPTRKALINNTINQLKSSGIWDKMDLLYMFAGHDSDACLLNWKSPSLYKCTNIASTPFTVDRGYTSNGTSQYLKTGWNPATNGVNFTLNDAAVGAYSRTNITAANDIIIGNGDGSANQTAIFPKISGNSLQGRINNNGGFNIQSVVSDSLGMLSVVRTASNISSLYKRAVALGSSTNSTIIPSSELYILSFNNNGSPILWFHGQCSFAYAGSSSINQTTLNTIIEGYYLTSIGANV